MADAQSGFADQEHHVTLAVDITEFLQAHHIPQWTQNVDRNLPKSQEEEVNREKLSKAKAAYVKELLAWMMPLRRQESGLYACSLVFRISRLSGLFMFHSSGRFSPSMSVCSVVKTILTSFALTLSSIDYFSIETTWYHDTLKTSLGMEVIEMFTQIVSVFVHLTVLITRKAKFEGFLLNFKNTEVKNVNRSAISVGLFSIAMIFASYTTMKYTGSSDEFLGGGPRVVAYTAYCFLNFFILLQFTAILKLFRLKFLRLVANFPITIDIHEHAQLLRSCEKLNSLYDWQLLLRVIHTFVNLLTHSSYIIGYLLMKNSVDYDYSQSLIAYLFFTSNIIFTIYELLHLAGSCKQTKEAADLFVKELFNMLRGSQELCTNDKLYLYVTAKPTVNFTACGFFHLGYPLVTSIIAAAATYLVIIVQFNMPK